MSGGANGLPYGPSVKARILAAATPDEAEAIYTAALQSHRYASPGTKSKWRRALSAVTKARKEVA